MPVPRGGSGGSLFERINFLTVKFFRSHLRNPRLIVYTRTFFFQSRRYHNPRDMIDYLRSIDVVAATLPDSGTTLRIL